VELFQSVCRYVYGCFAHGKDQLDRNVRAIPGDCLARVVLSRATSSDMDHGVGVMLRGHGMRACPVNRAPKLRGPLPRTRTCRPTKRRHRRSRSQGARTNEAVVLPISSCLFGGTTGCNQKQVRESPKTIAAAVHVAARLRAYYRRFHSLDHRNG